MEGERRDLETLMDDVKTIKAILLNADAPLPPVWRLVYFVAVPALVVVALVKFFVPAVSALSFVDTALWLWVPSLSLVGVVVVVRIRHYLKQSGTRFMAQNRIRVFLYTRLVLAPAVFTVGALLSLNPAYSMDGAMLVLGAIGLTQLVLITPRVFRVAPLVLLFAGWAELIFDLRGPVWTLANTLAVATILWWVGALIEKGESSTEVPRA